MASNLGTSKEFIYSYIEYLNAAGVFSLLPRDRKGLRAVRKPAKVYLENPNLFGAVLSKAEVSAQAGAIRESFFLNQVGATCRLLADPQADFATESGQRFEVGGRSKRNRPSRRGPDTWIAVDDTDVGSGRRIPLWLFGFLY